jgi:hypothetical protein
VAADDGGRCAATRMCCALLVAPMTKEVGLPRKPGEHGASANRRAAELYAYAIAPIIAELKASCIVLPRAIADGLCKRQVRTARGGASGFRGRKRADPAGGSTWQPVQRSRLLVT